MRPSGTQARERWGTRVGFACSAMVALCPGRAAFAQSVSDPVEARALDRYPGAGTEVERTEVRGTTPVDLGEILRTLPGFFVRDDDGLRFRLHVGLRGLDPARSRYVTVLEDGVPIALAPYSQPDVDTVIPVEMIERVEVLRGAGTVAFGPQTQGAVLDLVTPAPPRHERATARAIGALPLGLGLHASYGTSIGNAGFIVSLARRQGDGPARTPWESTAVVARFRLELGARSDLHARFSLMDDGGTVGGTGLTTSMFDGGAYRTLPVAPWDWMRSRRHGVVVVHEFRVTDTVRLRTTVYGTLADRRTYAQSLDRVELPGRAYARIVGDASTPGGALFFRDDNLQSIGDYQVMGIEPRLQAGFRLAGLRNELDVGGRVLLERTLVERSVGTSGWARSGNVDHSESREGFAVAAYLQDRLWLTDRWQVLPAVRFESFSLTRAIRRDGGIDATARGQASNVGVIPGGVVQYVTPAWLAFVGAHLAWAPGAANSRGASVTGSVLTPPEQGATVEAGLRTRSDGALRAEVTGFWLERRSPLVRIPSADAFDMLVVADPARHLGVEAAVRFDLGRALRASWSAYLDARYQFVDARFVEGSTAGRAVPYAPAHIVTARLGFEHAGGFSVNASAYAFSDFFTDVANSDAPSIDGLTGRVPVAVTIDATLRYRHRETGLGLGVGARNLTGQPYIASRSPGGIVPGGGRQVFAVLDWEY